MQSNHICRNINDSATQNLRQSISLCTLHEIHGSKGESSVSRSECSHTCRWNRRSFCCWGEISFLEAKSHLRWIFLSVSHLPEVLLCWEDPIKHNEQHKSNRLNIYWKRKSFEFPTLRVNHPLTIVTCLTPTVTFLKYIYLTSGCYSYLWKHSGIIYIAQIPTKCTKVCWKCLALEVQLCCWYNKTHDNCPKYKLYLGVGWNHRNEFYQDFLTLTQILLIFYLWTVYMKSHAHVYILHLNDAILFEIYYTVWKIHKLHLPHNHSKRMSCCETKFFSVNIEKIVSSLTFYNMYYYCPICIRV